MGLAFLAIATLHGLIHVMGGAKAFGYDDVPLHVTVSKPAGVAWFACAVLWLFAAALHATASAHWWTVAAASLVLSQMLIISAWKDAKFGTVANLILLVPIAGAALAHSPLGVPAQFAHTTQLALEQSTPRGNANDVSDADIAHLPRAVQNYLRYTHTIGHPRIENYRVSFTGDLRERPDSAWMPSRVSQFSVVHPAGRWFAVSATNKGVPFDALHIYEGAHATFEVRVFTLIKVVDARGPEMDQSETVTLFNDMCLLAPATLIDPAIQWREVDAMTVTATFSNAGHSIAATLHFDSEGALTNFVSDDRYRSLDGRTYERHRWSTPVSRYAWYNGRRVATDAEARWTLPGGEFTYARFTLTDVRYNQ